MDDIEEWGSTPREEDEPIRVSIHTRKRKDPTGSAVYVHTWGCSHNLSDSEYMSGILEKSGFSIECDPSRADLWVLNSCTVKTPSEDQSVNMLKKANEQGKKVVFAGCVSQAEPNARWLKDVSIVGVRQIDQIADVVDKTLRGERVKVMSRNRIHPNLALPKKRRNPLIEVLAINTGCLNRCTYCKTKSARGDLKSYSLEELVEQAQTAFKEGVRELWLTSEDLGAWGRDIGMVIPDLLNALVKVIPDGCMMRLGMTNPPYIMDHLHEMADILSHPRVYRFLHIPVQSGSDEVLRHMKREYTSYEFTKAIDFLLERIPDLYIATDFICAYPTETEEDFKQSMALVQKYQFPSLFINQYYPRSGTPAALLPRVAAHEAKRRTGEMSRYFRGYSRYTEKRIGEEVTVLVCEMASDGVNVVGHTPTYEQVILPPTVPLGSRARVRITGVNKFNMIAVPLSTEPSIKSYLVFLILPLLFVLLKIVHFTYFI